MFHAHDIVLCSSEIPGIRNIHAACILCCAFISRSTVEVEYVVLFLKKVSYTIRFVSLCNSCNVYRNQRDIRSDGLLVPTRSFGLSTPKRSTTRDSSRAPLLHPKRTTAYDYPLGGPRPPQSARQLATFQYFLCRTRISPIPWPQCPKAYKTHSVQRLLTSHQELFYRTQ
jgi:hypothetical protein